MIGTIVNPMMLNMFNAQYFRTYITLVETGSFTRTAQRLDMTQPGVSQHIRKLERYLNKALLERRGRGFTLTESGRRAYDYALKLFAEHEQFRHALDDDLLDSGECRIASPGSVGLMFYPYILGQQQRHPNLTVSYSFAFNHEIVNDLLEGRYDIGIVTEAVNHPDLECYVWHQEPLCLVVPADFVEGTLSDLMGIGFLNYYDGINHANALLRANYPDDYRSMTHFRHQGFTNEVSMVLDAVARGLGFTVVSRLVLETSPWQRQVKALNLPNTVNEVLYLLRRRDSVLPKRYEKLLNGFHQERMQEITP